MGGGDHHAGDGTGLADGITELGSRPDAIEYVDMQAVGAQDISCDPGKKFRIVAAVVRNADGHILTLCMLENVVCQALGSHTDSVPVHPVGTHTHHSPESSCAELKILIESKVSSSKLDNL